MRLKRNTHQPAGVEIILDHIQGHVGPSRGQRAGRHASHPCRPSTAKGPEAFSSTFARVAKYWVIDDFKITDMFGSDQEPFDSGG
jgi:hypothetical protein